MIVLVGFVMFCHCHVVRGIDATKLRVELWVDVQIARSGGSPSMNGDELGELSWDIGDLRGKWGMLVHVDDATAIGGHLDVDNVWLRD